MSLLSDKLQALVNVKNALITSVNNKGATLPVTAKLTDVKTAIDNIQTGGTGTPTKQFIEVSGSYDNFPVNIGHVKINYVNNNPNAGSIQNFTNALSLEFDEGITTIGAYSNWISATFIILPNSLTTLAASAFYTWGNLVQINIPDDLKVLPFSCFYGCYSLTSINLNNVHTLSTDTFSGCSKLASINLSKVTSLATRTFYNCQALTTVILSPSIKNIQSQTFYQCIKLTTINLSDVEIISSNAFQNCYALENVDLKNVTSVQSNAFIGCSKLITVDISKAVLVGANSFQNCIALENVTLNPDLGSLSSMAFYGCSKLSTIDLKNMSGIGQQCFELTGLTSIDLKNVNIMGYYAFRNCTKLTSVIFRKNIQASSGTQWFVNCTLLQSIEIHSTAYDSTIANKLGLHASVIPNIIIKVLPEFLDQYKTQFNAVGVPVNNVISL